MKKQSLATKMASRKDMLARLGWLESARRQFKNLIKILYFSITWLFLNSGLESIYGKLRHSKTFKPSPVKFIWLFVIYVVLFVVASQRYANRVDIIENRANSIFAQLAIPAMQKKALSKISTVQKMYCPPKPNILNPFSVFTSLFRDSKYEDMIAHLKGTVEDWKASLDSVYLREAILWEANLREANLKGADLSKANLWKANFQEANLQEADLRGADLRGANLQKANLQKADLRSADLRRADLRGAKLQRTSLQSTNLRRANLQRASLLGGDLQSAFLQEADLQYTNLWGADLRKADLAGANLQKAGFQYANLRDANLRDAFLRDAFFQHANLQGVELGGAKELTGEQLCKASILYKTQVGRELETHIKQECSDLIKKPQNPSKNTSVEKK